MTNEEKARELFKTEVGNLDVPDFDREFEILTAIEAMAEWKDKQFKEYLAKKKEELFNTNCLSVLPFLEFIDEIINELLGGEQYDNL